MDSVIFLAYAAAYVALAAWCGRLAAARGWSRAAMLPTAVILALAYDNLVLGAGRFIGEGGTLEALHAGRYRLTVLTPLLFVWAVDALRRADVPIVRNAAAKAITWLAAAVLVAVTWLREIRGLELVTRDEYGALSYVSAAPPGMPVVPVIVALVLLIAGALVWKRERWPWLFLGALAMTIASVVEIPVPSNAATNAFELLLLTSIVATTAFQDRRQRGVALSNRARN